MENIKRNWPVAWSIHPAKLTPGMISALAEAEVRELEISCGKLPPWFDEFNYMKNAKKIYNSAKEGGLNISSIHLPFSSPGTLDPSNPDRTRRIAATLIQSDIIKAAADSGIGICVIHPSCEPYADGDRTERLKWSINTIATLCQVAKENGMVMALENLPRTCLCRTSDEMKLYLDAIPDLRVCFDTNHSLVESNVDYIKAVGDKIITLHVSDYDFIDERHLIPTDGLIDWKELIETLDEVGYNGRFLYETGKFESPAKIRENYEYLMSL